MSLDAIIAKREYRHAALIALMVILLWNVLPCHADQAIVVGVNSYSALPASGLSGCENDAHTVASTLKGQGFSVNTLLAGQATQEHVLNALRFASARGKADSRFFFYFAGLGSRTMAGAPALLLRDAVPTPDGPGHMSVEQLTHLIRIIPAASYTLVFDCGFSKSANWRAVIPPTSPRTRFIALGDNGDVNSGDLIGRPIRADSRDLTIENNPVANVLPVGEKSPRTIFFTAASINEPVLEAKFGGVSHGVFTYFLTRQLNRDGYRILGHLEGTVANQVAAFTHNLQHPTFSESHGAFRLNEQGHNPQAGAHSATLWDEYNGGRADSSRIQMRIAPDHTTFQVDQPFSLSLKVGVEGYLLVLERGVSGRLHVLFPIKPNLKAAYVQSGNTLYLPTEGAGFSPNATGFERVKALLFTSRIAAQAMLSKLPDADAKDQEPKVYASRKSPLNSTDYYQCNIIFEVVN